MTFLLCCFVFDNIYTATFFTSKTDNKEKAVENLNNFFDNCHIDLFSEKIIKNNNILFNDELFQYMENCFYFAAPDSKKTNWKALNWPEYVTKQLEYLDKHK